MVRTISRCPSAASRLDRRRDTFAFGVPRLCGAHQAALLRNGGEQQQVIGSDS